MVLLLSLLAFFWQSPERTKATDYPVHAKAGSTEIGAEYSGRTVFSAGPAVVLEDHIAILVAVFPKKGETIKLSHSDFVLKINGKKPPLMPQPPSIVAVGLKYDDWEQRPNLQIGGSAGNAGVLIGRPRPTERFPGDQRGRTTPIPRAPEPTDRSGVERQPEEKPEEAVVRLALVEGPITAPVSGYIFFEYRGKTKSIKRAELSYSGAGTTEATLSLF